MQGVTLAEGGWGATSRDDARAVIAVLVGRTRGSAVWNAAGKAVQKVGGGDGAIGADPARGTHTLAAETQATLASTLRVACALPTSVANGAYVHAPSRAIKHGGNGRPVELAGVSRVALKSSFTLTISKNEFLFIRDYCG
jgi:hypothetical protein